MGKRRIIAETGAGQHGVATATVCALLGLDVRRLHGRGGHGAAVAQRLPHAAARRDGARASTPAAETLKDAINEAMRDWVTNVADSYYLLGSVLGPHPYPLMVREFQSVIGQEARAQCLDADRPPARRDRRVRRRRQQRDGHLRCVRRRPDGAADRRRGGRPRHRAGRACRAVCRRQLGVLQGTRSYVLQDEDGNIELTHSISAGLDYAAVGPEHAWLHDSGPRRVRVDRRRRGARARFSGWAARKGSCRRSSRRTRSPTRCRDRADDAAGRDRCS